MEYISQLFYEITSIIMALLVSLGAIATPGTNDLLRNIDPDTVIDFVVVGDSQVCNYNPSREVNLAAFSEDIMNSDIELDAFIIAGDVAENGFQDEFDRVYDNISLFNTKNFIMCSGNHDIRLREYEQSKERFLTFMNDLNGGNNAQSSLYYKYMVGDYTFLVIGSDKSEFEYAFLSDAQLQWLNLELDAATADGKPVFVISHYPLAEGHGLPNTWGSANNPPEDVEIPTYERKDDYDFTGSIGKQSNELYDILVKYENVFYITGHLHTGFGKYTYETISEENNVYGVNVPSVSINNKDGVYNNPATGLFVEVTDDQVIFYARDFAEGKFLTADQWSNAVKVFDIQ